MGLDLCRRSGELPKLVGHRGACAVAPENTMVSFERAWWDGADIIEFDVRLSRDKQVVVMHDAHVDRTTNGTGYVSEFTVTELKKLDAGSWFSPYYAGVRVPTLHEVLDWARDRLGLLIELKSQVYDGYEPELAPAVLTAIDAAGVADQVALISYQPRALVQVKAIAPHIPVGPLTPRNRLLQAAHRLFEWRPSLANVTFLRPLFSHIFLSPLRYTLNWGCDIVAPNIEVVTPLLVQAAHAKGCPVSSGGLLWDYPAAIRMGIDTVSANDPGSVRTRYLAAKQLYQD